ncbi:MAG: hypothetical protein RL094_133 [Candidatus Parcubacteria bacterium]|jgi:hypothetical protein
MARGTQYLKENLPRLPLDVQEAIVNTDYLAGLKRVQQENKLHLDQGEEIEDLTFKLMIGDIDPEEFPALVATNLHTDKNTALEITKKVEEYVMNPIRQGLENLDYTEETLSEEADGQKQESHENLHPNDILAEIENPTPAVAEVHKTTVTETVKRIPKVATADILANASKMFPTNPLDAAATVQQAQPATGTTPAQQVTTALNTNLTQTTVTKPEQIKTSLDPYKELI